MALDVMGSASPLIISANFFTFPSIRLLLLLLLGALRSIEKKLIGILSLMKSTVKS